jgi:hypothetical protein
MVFSNILLNVSRKLYLKEFDNTLSNTTGEVTKIELFDNTLSNDGDIYILDENINKNYKHSIPIEKRVKGVRISFTFREHATE